MAQFTIEKKDILNLTTSGDYTGEEVSNLFDGKITTFWNSFTNDANDATWFVVELTKGIKIDTIVIKEINLIANGSFGLKNYRIQASNDGFDFTDIYIGYCENRKYDVLELSIASTIDYKFIRFEALDSWYDAKRVYFAEFEINYSEIKKITLFNPTTNQHYSLAEKTLIPLPNSSNENMISFGIETGKEIKLDEPFDKINYPVEGNLKNTVKTMVKPLSIKFE